MLTSKFCLTLVIYTTLALILTTTSHASVDVNRRHGNLKRLIKKRSPFIERDNPFIPVIGAGADPATTTDLNQQTASTQVPPTATSIGGVVPPLSLSTSTSVDTVTSLSSTSSLVSSVSSTTSKPVKSTTVAAPPAVTYSFLPSSAAGPPSASAVIVTSTAAVASSTSTAVPSNGAGKHTTITVLIVIAASVGGVALLWTVIRKWKFRPSSQFEGRMQPIDWQPTISPEEGMGGHRRNVSGTSSFHSGQDHLGDNMAGRGVGTGYGEPDIVDSVVPGVPDHDFTAGPATLAPIGGYADLARGPSPQPQMQEALTRGPSMHRMQYDHQHGAPMHHTGYSQDAYDYNGGVTY
jgi:hypothetical protein